MPISWLSEHKPEETQAQRDKEWYTAANGEKIYNEGQRVPTLATSEGLMRSMTFQCVKSAKALGSVSKICRHGFRCNFDDKEAQIVDKAGKVHCVFKRSGGLYVCNMRLKAPAPFHRQEP